jgi:hypothetical protein
MTRSAWFIGFTPQLAGAASVADPDNPFDLAGEWQYHKPIDTVSLTMRDAMRGLPVESFAPPPATMLGHPRHGHSSATSARPRG